VISTRETENQHISITAAFTYKNTRNFCKVDNLVNIDKLTKDATSHYIIYIMRCDIFHQYGDVDQTVVDLIKERRRAAE